MGYSFVRVAPLAAAIFHFCFLFHTVNITSTSSVMTITTMIQPAMAPPTAAGTDTPVATLDSILESELVVEISQIEVLSQAEMMVAIVASTQIEKKRIETDIISATYLAVLELC